MNDPIFVKLKSMLTRLNEKRDIGLRFYAQSVLHKVYKKAPNSLAFNWVKMYRNEANTWDIF